LIVVYTPAGGQPEHYDASTLRVSEASIVQRTVDMKWAEVLEGLERDDLDAMRGIVWVIKKRSNPSLRFGDFDPGVNEMVTRMDRSEIERWVANIFDALTDQDDIDAFVKLATERAVDAAADPEHARALIEARAKAPKADEDQAPEQPEQQEETPAEAPSPSPTSSEPEPSTSDSSPTSSTSLPETSTS
jgi:ribosomal protein L12E/L44/L45/RPP1/RPP2